MVTEKKLQNLNVPELRTKAPLKSETKNVNLIDDINLMPRLIYIVIITNYSMHLSICKCQQSSVVNNNNINWCIPMTVCSHRDLCYRTAEFLWRSSSSTILFKARKSRTGFSGWCYQVLNISENEASTVALGTFLACLINLTEKKKFFLSSVWMVVWVLLWSDCLFLKILKGNSCISIEI